MKKIGRAGEVKGDFSKEKDQENEGSTGKAAGGYGSAGFQIYLPDS